MMKPRKEIRQPLSWALLGLCAAFLLIAVLTAPKGMEARYVSTGNPVKVEAIALDHEGINVNTADLEELDTLPGIGPVTGQAIIDTREAQGRFLYPEDLISVRGIGKKTIAKIRDLISVTDKEEEQTVENVSIGIIGGADGPTAIFLSGDWTAFIACAVGFLILIVGAVVIIRRMKKRRQS